MSSVVKVEVKNVNCLQPKNVFGYEAYKDKQNVTCFILLLNPCLKKHNN